MKNKTRKFFCLSIGWMLTLFGITVGNVSCVYGPAYDEDQMKKLNQLEADVEEIRQKVWTKEMEVLDLKKEAAKNEQKIKYLEQEKDSLKLLLENFEK
ncbi:MAG: hypothetical protein NTU73_09175 [Ignavibacteriae bacterium]|nr:hypothetical protein [Ignavibacteriota bacterium]